MCGISGIILNPGQKADRELAQTMANDMRLRGPDAQTSFCHENFSFSHSRLKIIDITDNANQPIFNENKDVAVVFNGEIYNFRELRGELQSKGHHFRTQSDTEVIVHGFEEWGTDSFRKLNGIFSFAIWDGREQGSKFFLVRDRVGAKPFFYSQNRNVIAFASELKPLMRVPWVSKEIEAQTLFYFLKYSHIPNPLSIFKNVSQLEPGHFLEVSDEIKKHCYWNSLSFYAAKKEEKSVSEWKQEFLGIWEHVIERQSISDVPLGCFLSGGVDSSLIASMMMRKSKQKLKTFCIGYKESKYNESPFAHEVASKIGADHHELIVEAKDFHSVIPDLPTFFDQPFADPTLLSSLLLSKFAKNHVSVAMSGDGADEFFWGYDYQRILAKLNVLLSMPSFFRKSSFSILEKTVGNFSEPYRKLFEILQFHNKEELFQYFVGTVGPMRLDRLRDLVNGEVQLSPPHFSGLLSQSKDLPWEDQIRYVFQSTFLVDTVLAKSDRASMAYGLETRVPFLDNEMIHFASRIPNSLNRQKGKQKTFLVEILRDSLGAKIAERPKQGFSIPMQEWLRGDLKFLIEEYVFAQKYQQENMLNSKKVAMLAKEHLSGARNHSHLLWSIISYRMWSEKYIGV